MFTLEDTKRLVESLNTGVALSESEAGVLAEDCFKKLSASFDECSKRAYDKAVEDAKTSVKKERLKAFKRGKDSAAECVEKSVKEAEENGYEAGRQAAIKESAETESEKVEELLGILKHLCQSFDKAARLIEIISRKETEEQMQESFRDTIGDYIGRKIDESFPEKMVVDYDRLNVLESVCESFKKTLCINDKEVADVVESTKRELKKEFDDAKDSLKKQTQRRIQAEQLLESAKAENLLLKKVSALPVNEQKSLLNTFRGASVATINESFDGECQKLRRLRQSSAKAVKPVVNDVICESKRAVKEAREAQKAVNESAERHSKGSAMDDYARACRFLSF